jgi:hypothetical protein
LSELDNLIMSKCPKIGRWAWVSVIQVIKWEEVLKCWFVRLHL